MTPKEIQSRVLYKDRLILVINKPAGLPVHAGPGGGPNLETSFQHLCYEHPRPPALAHRLDRDTSGCLVLGRHHKGLKRMGKLFQQGKVGKVYWAVCTSAPEQERGTISLPLRKLTPAGGWKMVVDPKEGQESITDYQVLGRSRDGLAWIECRPRTGRTHQIRVHMAALGAPLLGDPLYGQADRRPMHLHSRAVSIPLYADTPPIVVCAPPPAHMVQALKACGWDGVTP